MSLFTFVLWSGIVGAFIFVCCATQPPNSIPRERRRPAPGGKATGPYCRRRPEPSLKDGDRGTG